MIAAERPEFRERFQQLPWPQQLGNLASTLARISSLCGQPEYDRLIRDLLREGAVLVEWSAASVPADLLPELAFLQREVLAWRAVWPLEGARHLLALRARLASDLLLYRAGFIPPHG
ncbi:MAG: hypothetical protein ACPL7C_09455 [Anaerolineae bacterium]